MIPQLAAGIHAEMNMFGDNGAYKKFQQADKFCELPRS